MPSPEILAAFFAAALVCVLRAGLIIDRVRQFGRTARTVAACGGAIWALLGVHLARQGQ